ncbi:MAG: hypothetical protein HZA32_18815 [Opitutae bacterium]|nr:hypothetical protein [Opitutae bacterium]
MGETLNAAPARVRLWLVGLLVAGALLGEFLAFDRATSQHHAWVYPRWNDQIQYLTEAYTGYEHLREVGVARGLWDALVNPSAQGTLHDFGAITIFLFAGPSRSAALALNMLAFVAWQAALALAVWRRSRSLAFTVLAAALPLALAGPWLVRPGTAIDFRLDHLAVCAFGVLSAALLASDGFRSRRGSLAFGAACALALLTRFLTGTYLVLVFVGLFVWLVRQPDRRTRLAHLLFSAALAAALAAPIFWINRDWVWNYYVVGHFIGPESALRSPHLGLLDSVRFVFGHWADWHARASFGLAALGLAAFAAAVRLLPRKADAAPAAIAREWLGLGALLFFAPAVVLVFHSQKSEVVLGILNPGAVLALLGLVRWAAPGPRALAVAAGAALLFGGTSFMLALRAGANDPGFAADARRAATIADQLYEASRCAGLNRPNIATDEITDYLDAQILRVVCYERHRRWVQFEMKLPTGIAAEADDVIVRRLRESDFVFLTESGSRSQWPYDEQMRRLHPQLTVIAARELERAADYELFGRKVVLYCRRGITLAAPAQQR